MAMVEVNAINKTFSEGGRNLTVLDNLSFSVEKGQTVALMGSSGSGKTTLLQILGGLEAPTAGTIKINGKSVGALSPNEQALFRNQTIGFVFQFHHLLPDFNALENTMMPGIIAGRSPKECQEQAREILRTVGLSNRIDHFPSELSGGERQRIALARALFNSPALVLADEPTGNLDAENTAQFLDLIKSHNQKNNQTFIIATHDTTVAQALDYRLELSNGTVLSKEIHHGTM